MNLRLLELSGAYVNLRNQTSIGFAKTVTKEETMLKISQYSVEANDKTIYKFLESTLADLIYCTDEVGYSGFCNKRNRSVIGQLKRRINDDIFYFQTPVDQLELELAENIYEHRVDDKFLGLSFYSKSDFNACTFRQSCK
ncbi:MAG: hypothetical protein EZS28_005601 [Streblomastix strix]|uniref:Uncharacterized protein n=1 Tax=Streblomastix strix TaxID=222440 RepID=A0A5J4WVB7_9EUKA|nr:MAG: hypothetical protein EZS28_005601 [Streblomastix strix]